MEALRLSDDELIDHVLTWAARVARGTAELLDLIGELDAREAWAAHGITSCAAWLSWRLAWSDTTAREHVRVARALRSLPLIRAELGEGRLSYSQVRAVTRIATVGDEPRWLELARHSTGAQLDKIARGAARARAAQTPARERPMKQAAQVAWDEDGDLILTLRIPAHQAVPVLAVLEEHQAAEQTERGQALTELVTQAISPASAEAPAPTDHSQAADLLAEPTARGFDPLQPYPYVEPDYPIRSDRLGLPLTDDDRAAIAVWESERNRLRAIRDAWNAQRERLLVAAASRRVPTGRATLADGLVRAVTRPADGPRTTVRLLLDPVSGWARTQHDELLPPATVHELLRHDQGRATRQVSPGLRRLLGQLDGERCRFPGCRQNAGIHGPKRARRSKMD